MELSIVLCVNPSREMKGRGGHERDSMHCRMHGGSGHAK